MKLYELVNEINPYAETVIVSENEEETVVKIDKIMKGKQIPLLQMIEALKPYSDYEILNETENELMVKVIKNSSCQEHYANKGNLLIIGTDDYASVIKDIAEGMDCFSKISFLDNRFGQEGYNAEQDVIGKIENIGEYAVSYQYAIPSYSDSEKRLRCINELEENCFRIPVIVSPRAYVSKYAQIQKGSVVEALSSIQTNAAIAIGVYVSSGAVVSANSFVGDVCFIGANAVVCANSIVPAHTRIDCGDVFTKEVSMNLLNKMQSDLEHKSLVNDDKQICSSCAEGAYWLKLDPNEVFCPKISLLHNGRCAAYRKME